MTVPNGAKCDLRARCLPPGSVPGSCAGPPAFAADGGTSVPATLAASLRCFGTKRSGEAEPVRPVPKARSLAALASCRGARGRVALTSGPECVEPGRGSQGNGASRKAKRGARRARGEADFLGRSECAQFSGATASQEREASVER